MEIKRFKLIKHTSIESYTKAEQTDRKIQELLTDANMYRTMSVASIALLIECIYLRVIGLFAPERAALWVLALILMGVLFLESYMKQTRHIVDRVNAIAKGEND